MDITVEELQLSSHDADNICYSHRPAMI